MNRRSFLSFLTVSGLGPGTIQAGLEGSRPSGFNEEASSILPYFLDSGEVSSAEQQEIERFIDLQQQRSHGLAIRLRGRPRRAPTYRLFYWDGEPGDPAGSLRGPLGLSPGVEESPTGYQLNAQILTFHPCSKDWDQKEEKGLLTIEFRAAVQGEPMTWLFAQHFELYEGGISTVGAEYVAQREGVPTPVITEQPNVDVRIQLIRDRKKNRTLGNILKVASFVTGVGNPFGSSLPTAPNLEQMFPSIQVPHLAREGVALSQAVFGSFAEEEPIWKSGFTSYGLSPAGSRLKLRPGFYVVMDEGRETDVRSIVLDAQGDRMGLFRNGRPLDVNYLVLAFEISPVPA